MADSFAFDWWPGLLAWILVFELILLAVMAAARSLAVALGKGDPRDFFVIFHRVFWRAMRSPSLYPLPVNYQPVPPKKPKQQVDAGQQEALTEDELDSLLSCDGDAPAVAELPTSVPGRERDASDQDDLSGGTMRCELDVRVIGPGPSDAVRGIEAGVLLIDVTVAPDDGRANGTAIGLVATVLRVESHQIAITAGHTRPDKTLKISGLSDADLARRKSEMGVAATGSSPPPADAGDDPWGEEPSLSFQDD